MERQENQKQINDLAAEVMTLSRNTLLVDLRFLDSALSRLEPVPTEGGTAFSTDGKRLFYHPLQVLRLYKAEKEAPARAYLHMVLHCVLNHSFVGKKIERLAWDTACDIAVENMIDELGIGGVLPSRQKERETAILYCQRRVKALTAERIYHLFREENLSEKRLYEIRSAFFTDEHAGWYGPETEENAEAPTKGWQQKEMEGSNSDSANGMNGETGRAGRSQAGNGDQESEEGKGESENGKGRPRSTAEKAETAKEWKRLAESIEQDLETFSQKAGGNAGSLIQNLKEINREKVDYEAFLKKFAVHGEVLKTSEDEFDYVFYTYGLKLYGNMPLIEPLEYRDAKRIREFVIAIDTSGSCSGELVRHFIQKTYGILKSTESFFSKVNLHIIQCDTRVQHDEKITSKEEFDRYIKDVRIYGGGGTDFRPVFRYVDELIGNKEFRDLRGLIYFTDGLGSFPEQKPDYETAFVFVDDEDKAPEVPPWAIKLILHKGEIEEEGAL